MKLIKQILSTIVFCFVAQSGFSQVGINTITPLSMLDINGNLTIKEVGILNSNVVGSGPLLGGPFGNKTLINDGVYISITPSGATNDFELPNAASVPGRIYIVRNISTTNYAYIYTAGGGLYAKNSIGVTTQPLDMQHTGLRKTLFFISDGLNWTFFE
jgi:hypothetical protein